MAFGLLGDGDGHFLKFHYVARPQFFPSLGFYLAVHPHLAVVDSDVGLTASAHQVQHFEEVVERDVVGVGKLEGHGFWLKILDERIRAIHASAGSESSKAPYSGSYFLLIGSTK